MRFVGRGHPNVRATHAKTLELTPDSDISERATCVVAVRVRAEGAVPYAGPLLLTLRVAGYPPVLVRAQGNSSWLPGDTAVVRRSPMQLSGTFATGADRAAADLPRDLAAALRSPDTIVVVDVTPAPSIRRTVVLCAADALRPADDRLRSEIAAASRVVAEDAPARRLTDPPPGGAGARTLVVATREVPGGSMLTELGDLETAVETVGLLPQLAAAAASPSRAPLTVTQQRADKALGAAAPDHRLLARADADDVPAVLRLAGQLRPGTAVVFAQQFAAPLRIRAGDAVSLPADEPVYCCFAPERAPAPLRPAARAAIFDLLAEGASTKTAARVLAELAGLGRREAYDAVLAVARHR